MTRTRNTSWRPPPPVVQELLVIADYRHCAFGPGYLASITAGEEPARTIHGQDVHDALHLVMGEVRRIAEETRRAVLTVHTLDGDPVAFAELAEELGFVDCVRGVGGSDVTLAR